MTAQSSAAASAHAVLLCDKLRRTLLHCARQPRVGLAGWAGESAAAWVLPELPVVSDVCAPPGGALGGMASWGLVGSFSFMMCSHCL